MEGETLHSGGYQQKQHYKRNDQVNGYKGRGHQDQNGGRPSYRNQREAFRGGRGRGTSYQEGPREAAKEIVRPAKQADLKKKENVVIDYNEWDKAFSFGGDKEQEDIQQEKQVQEQKQEVRQTSTTKQEENGENQTPKQQDISQTNDEFQDQEKLKPYEDQKKGREQKEGSAGYAKKQKFSDNKGKPEKNGKNHLPRTKHVNGKQEKRKEETKEDVAVKATDQNVEVKEEKKEPVKQDFVPDESFEWQLDLESVVKQGKKKGKNEAANFEPVVIKTENAGKTHELDEDLKLKLNENIDFSMTSLNKLNKGFVNSKNSCYMNVIFQALLACPPFYNMLVKISEQEEYMKDLGPESLLRKFVTMSKHFNPKENIDKKSQYSKKTVDGEKIFQEFLSNFNPYQEHQDCHEFFAIIVDMLHDELKLIYHPNNQNGSRASAKVDEWREVGEKNTKLSFNNDQSLASQPSLIRDIFGGLLRTEFHVESSKNVSVTYEPFSVLNLEISKCEDLESCLYSFFTEKRIEDYKIDGRKVRAYYKQQIDKLPNNLVLHLKRFIYKDRPIKMKEDIYFPKVLTIEDHVVSTSLKIGAFNKPDKSNGRKYRLYSVVNHRGNDLGRGHYVCYTLDSDNEWVYQDDEKFKIVNEDTVLESQAYLLFYELIQ